MTTQKRLVEVAFPLEQTSLDSLHEKNVRHGHISTLHIWPARRPLAASRAALIATLLPDPGNKEKRDEILNKLAGTVVKVVKKKKLPSGKVEDVVYKETVGGILHWGRESGADFEWLRKEIHKAYDGRVPRVLDPFAGGGAIPLEAMRLGCEVTAADINPVAWFILKCTLEYPQKLSGQKRRLPDFALRDRDFMFAYLKALGLKASDTHMLLDLPGKISDSNVQDEMFGRMPISDTRLEVDAAWHLRAWGYWVLKRARKELAKYYPTYAEFCSLKPYASVPLVSSNDEPLKLLSVNDEGDPQIEVLNIGFERSYLENEKNPRWVAKPSVAYLWARTVNCKACRATIPLLKTLWLAKKDKKRVLLKVQPNPGRSGVVFAIESNVKIQGGNPAQRREYDKRIGKATMSRSGAECPCCGTIMTMEDLRIEGQAKRLGTVMTTVVVSGPKGKEYRLPTDHELEVARCAENDVPIVFADIPFNLPTEPTPKGGNGASRAFSVDGYGLDQWSKLFTPRQLVAYATLIKSIRELFTVLKSYPEDWRIALVGFLSCVLGKQLDYGNALCSWYTQNEQITHLFNRFALPIKWDFAETSLIGGASGSWASMLDSVGKSLDVAMSLPRGLEEPKVFRSSAVGSISSGFDAIVTDPPYYDAIPYADAMDFFYVWHRRTLFGLGPEFDKAFKEALSPKWDHDLDDGELIDDSSRFDGNGQASKENYEKGMARSFAACHASLNEDGRLVIVFAHKHPDAWETLVSAIIKAGFVVDGSWPIQTEMSNRTRALSSAALSSSVWLVCRKRDMRKRAGWDSEVLREMEIQIKQRLRDFWDIGIRGPDFVWAATGPALEAYSQYPAVKKATEQGAVMSVKDFLRHVRRMVVDFVVGRVLSGGRDGTETQNISLDDVTTYYLLHRNDFGLKDGPAGACILYAVSCGLSERLLADQYEILSRGKGAATDAADEAEDNGTAEDDLEESVGSGGTFKLKGWNQRKNRGLGFDLENGRPVPLIDQVHKLMQLWKAGDESKVNDYLEQRGLRRSPMFAQLVQALIEKSRAEGQGEECSLLEKLSNHLQKIGATAQPSLSLDA